MLYWLAQQLAPQMPFLHVLSYLTLRAILAALTALGISMAWGPWFIRRLGDAQLEQVIRQDGPSSHFSKQGTPTMGGGMILLSIAISVLCWGSLDHAFVWVATLTTLGFGLIGFVDDYLKIHARSSQGLSARYKFMLQLFGGLVASWYVYGHAATPAQTALFLPLFKDFALPLGWGFVALSTVVIVGFSNAVNLTDGLDGLAILPTVLVAAALGIFAYLSGHANFALYLSIPHVPGAGELSVFCGAIVGAGLGFLWFNTYPAQVFMGDVGSLGLGAALGLVAVCVRQEFVLMLMGGVFVVETLSVIIQVVSFRLTGRRVFKMAPLHHHFELKGWPEPRIIVRFWIITFILVLLGLSTLKLR